MAANDFTLLREDSAARYVNKQYHPVTSGLSANGNPTITAGTDSETLIYSTALTGNRTISCSNTGAWKGAKFRITRTDTAAQTLDINDGSAALLKQIGSGVAAYVDVIFDGTAWKLTAYGAL